MKQPAFLPMSRKEMDALGWDALDVLLLSGDAYVDHPSFGTALLGRWLIQHGFRVGIVAQPEWKNREKAILAIQAMGRPRLFAGTNAGAIDSMLAHYTAFRKKRSEDAYTPGGEAGSRPNRAVIMYTGFLRQAFPGLPVVVGGIEASLRRISHYDFWEDKLRRSVLLDAKADLLIYGMGEVPLLSIANKAKYLLEAHGSVERSTLVEESKDISGIVYSVPTKGFEVSSLLPSTAVHECLASPSDNSSYTLPTKNQLQNINESSAVCDKKIKNAMPTTEMMYQNALPTNYEKSSNPNKQKYGSKNIPSCEVIALPSHEDILATPQLLMESTVIVERQVHAGAQKLWQVSGDRVLIVNPPIELLSEATMDLIYGLPYSRLPHPSYTKPIPAWEMIRTSITSHRGCGGGCSFCALAMHQGRRIASRSESSLLAEAKIISHGPEKGKTVPQWSKAISDVGGPSANMWQATCTQKKSTCHRDSCMHPKVCAFFNVDQMKGVRTLRKIKATEGINHVRVASGVRFDLALQNKEAMFGYTSEFTGGQLKVAPEHICSDILHLMRKPSVDVFSSFLTQFFSDSSQAGKEQYTIPYLMSAFPGCTMEHMKKLKEWLAERRWNPQQVQCFIPIPGTVATAMFYGGIDAEGNSVYVARSDKERLEQHHLLFSDMKRRPSQPKKYNQRKNDPNTFLESREKRNTRKGASTEEGPSGVRRDSFTHASTKALQKSTKLNGQKNSFTKNDSKDNGRISTGNKPHKKGYSKGAKKSH